MAVPDDASDRRAVILMAVDESSLLADLSAALADDYRLVTCAAAVAAVRQRELGASLIIIDAAADPQGLARTCRRIRAASSTPIVALGSAAEETDIAQTLEAGADDYVTAPLGAGELAARIRALLRRMASTAEECRIVAGPLDIDTRRHVALLDGRELALTATEFALLALLARHRDRVVPREDILARVWGADRADTHRLLRVALSRLRTKLGARSRDDIAIEAVAGVGYQLVASERS